MVAKGSPIWDAFALTEMPNDKLAKLLFAQVRNIWSEDGLYYLGIEQRFGTEQATEIDREVWAVMGKLEARRVKEVLGVHGGDIASFYEILKHTSWLLEFENKECELHEDRLIIRNTKCRVQFTRVEKGLGEFGCKQVRSGYLKNFIQEINPRIKIKCNICPPDEHPEDLYCEWEFVLK